LRPSPWPKEVRSAQLRASATELIRETARDGQDSLKTLDDFRYGEAVELFATGKAQRPMELPDVERLVQWKLYASHMSQCRLPYPGPTVPLDC
jgi:hypothetical protein